MAKIMNLPKERNNILVEIGCVMVYPTRVYFVWKHQNFRCKIQNGVLYDFDAYHHTKPISGMTGSIDYKSDQYAVMTLTLEDTHTVTIDLYSKLAKKPNETYRSRHNPVTAGADPSIEPESLYTVRQRSHNKHDTVYDETIPPWDDNQVVLKKG